MAEEYRGATSYSDLSDAVYAKGRSPVDVQVTPKGGGLLKAVGYSWEANLKEVNFIRMRDGLSVLVRMIPIPEDADLCFRL